MKLLTLKEASTLLDISKPCTYKAARREQWPVVRKGNVHLYDAEDIREYRDHRYRTRLAKSLGWKYPGPGQGLCRDTEIDTECPECSSFAIEWPMPPQIPQFSKCLKGHIVDY
jgi:predicted DNA-binding transcriptional regulator AlpA